MIASSMGAGMATVNRKRRAWAFLLTGRAPGQCSGNNETKERIERHATKHARPPAPRPAGHHAGRALAHPGTGVIPQSLGTACSALWPRRRLRHTGAADRGAGAPVA